MKYQLCLIHVRFNIGFNVFPHGSLDTFDIQGLPLICLHHCWTRCFDSWNVNNYRYAYIISKKALNIFMRQNSIQCHTEW